MSSSFNFDTPEEKRRGLAWAFALWLFCSTNLGFLPLSFRNGTPIFSFSLTMLYFLGRAMGDPVATVCLAWFAIVGFVANKFLKTQGKRCEIYFIILVILVSLLSIPHPWLVDIILLIASLGGYIQR